MARGYYTKDGWPDIDRIYDESRAFLTILSARGVGKTHGTIAKMYRDEIPFIYSRTNEKQAEFARTSMFSPLSVVAQKEGFDVSLDTLNGIGNVSLNDDLIGHVMALSTVQNLRGFESPETECIIWDEFIRQRTERRSVKDEYDAMKNMYETINRNRELDGHKPIKMILLGNWNITNSDVLRGMDAFPMIEESARKGGVLVHNGVMSLIALQKSPKSEEKRDTVLYGLPDRDGDFSRMAIENSSPLTMKPSRVPLNEYLPVMVWERRIMIYQHKSREEYHISDNIVGKCANVCPSNVVLMSPTQRRLLARIAVALTTGRVTVSSIRAAAELFAFVGIDA